MIPTIDPPPVSGVTRRCQNCGSDHLRHATYDLVSRRHHLPALHCEHCGCLELDEGRLAFIAASLRADHLTELRGGELRREVRRLLAVEDETEARREAWPRRTA